MYKAISIIASKVRQFISNLTFKSKLIITYSLISVVPVIIVGVFSFSVSNKMIIDMKSEAVEKEFASHSEKIGSVLSDVESVSISLFSNRDIQRSLAEQNGIDDMKKSDFYNSVSAISLGILNNKQYISLINVFGKNGVQFKSQAYTTELFNDYSSCRKYLDEIELKGPSGWYGSEIFNIFNSRRYNLMNIKIIRDIYSLEELGVLIISVDEAFLRNIYATNGNKSFIADRSGKIVSHVDKSEINRKISSEDYYKRIIESGKNTGSFLYTAQNKKVLVTYSRIKVFGGYLINIIDYDEILKESSKIRNLTFMMTAICLFLAICLAFIITRNLTKPILRLKHIMAAVEEGNLDMRFEKRNNDEISLLGDNFNKMLDRIKNFIKEVKFQERLKKNSELKLMQAQINPHMLYNTFDSLQESTDVGDISRVSQVTRALSTFFKISLSKGDTFIPVWQELEHVKSYIEIQRLCSAKEITLETDINEDILKCRIIKHTFQPLVENAIMHGFKGYQDKGRIVIKAWDEPDKEIITFMVEDNGMGLLEKDVERINIYLDTNTMEDVNKPFGIKNVNDRIKNFYGEEFGIRVESEFGCYTRIYVKISRAAGSV